MVGDARPPTHQQRHVLVVGKPSPFDVDGAATTGNQTFVVRPGVRQRAWSALSAIVMPLPFLGAALANEVGDQGRSGNPSRAH